MKTNLNSKVSILCLLLLIGCEQKADIQSPFHFANDLFSFDYPANWDITEEETMEWGGYIFIESPGDAIFIIEKYPKEDALALNDFVTGFVESFQEELPVGDFQSVSRIPIEQEISGVALQGVRERFLLRLLGEEVPHRRTYFSLEGRHDVVYLTAQTAEEDIPLVQAGFELIWNTFKIK